MKKRTKQFALEIIRLVASLPKTTEGRAIGKLKFKILKSEML